MMRFKSQPCLNYLFLLVDAFANSNPKSSVSETYNATEGNSCLVRGMIECGCGREGRRVLRSR